MSTCPVSVRDIYQFDLDGTQPKNCFIAAVIKTGILLTSISKSKHMSDQENLLGQAINEICCNVDWSISFTQPVVIYSDEVLRVEILVLLQKYFREKCCNIENIWIISTGNFDLLKPWWKSYCSLFAIKSFNIEEWPTSDTLFLSQLYAGKVEPDWSLLFNQKQHSVCSLFSLYGGSYSKLDRCYLTLRLCELGDHGMIDFMGRFETKQNLIDYTENITYFKNQQEVEIVSSLYDRYVVDMKLQPTFDIKKYPPKFNESIDWNGTQWLLDQQCVFNVSRETNDSECIPDFTEKTLRAFCHFCMVLPVGYNSHACLKKLGFWFPESEIDYDYSQNFDYQERVLMIINNLKKIEKSPGKYAQLVNKYRSQLIQNAKLAWNMISKTA